MNFDVMGVIQGFGIYLTLYGVPFFFSFWTLALAIALSFMARGYIAKQMRERPGSNHNVAAIGAALTVIVSVLAHEVAHSVAGWTIGMPTKSGGMSWWGAYVMFDTALNTIPPLHEILIGLSGIGANLIICGISTLLVWQLEESRFENAVQFVAMFNFRLAVLNLLPIVGLDGSKVLDGILRPILPASAIAFILMGTTIILLPKFFGFWSKEKPSQFEQYLERI